MSVKVLLGYLRPNGRPVTDNRFHCHVGDAGGHHPLSKYQDRHAGYFRFAIVRNPWDRLVSAYFYLLAGGNSAADRQVRDRYLARYGGSFSAFARGIDAVLHLDHFRPQCHWICDGKKQLLTDYVGRFEHFEESCRQICTALDLPIRRVPQINPSRHGDYRAYFDPKAATIVADAYRQDIDMFGYDFAQPPPRPTAPGPLWTGGPESRKCARS